MRNVLICIALLLSAPLGSQSAETWKIFRSPTGFSAAYPPSWFRFGVSPDSLYILSSKGGAEGIVIRHGQAEIIVMEVANSSQMSLSGVVENVVGDATVLLRRDIPYRTDDKGCKSIVEVISREPAVPPEDSPIKVPNIINTDFFCETDGNKFETLLRNWEDDNRQSIYQRTALRVAKSIRTD